MDAGTGPDDAWGRLGKSPGFAMQNFGHDITRAEVEITSAATASTPPARHPSAAVRACRP
jgi:hypothetical protein